jgi:hypothetical protein
MIFSLFYLVPGASGRFTLAELGANCIQKACFIEENRRSAPKKSLVSNDVPP